LTDISVTFPRLGEGHGYAPLYLAFFGIIAVTGEGYEAVDLDYDSEGAD
jgi:hypothetical protein